MHEHLLSVAQLVRSRIADGWQPIGGICVTRGEYYIRALVKYEEPPMLKNCTTGSVTLLAGAE